jgi:tetratricopeptide (TPR) repeat protein
VKNINKSLKEAIFQFYRKNYEDSKKIFQEVLEKDPVNPEAHYYIGLIYSKENNYQKAVLHLKSVVDQSVNFLFTQQCRMILGYIYFKNKEYSRAEHEFLEVKSSKLKIPQVFAALAAVYYYLGDREKTVEFAEKAFNMDQFNLNAKNTYGFILCDYEIDIAKGIEILREVIRIKPDNPSYLDSLGWGYFKKGDIQASIKSLERAMELSKDQVEIKNHFEIVVNRKMKVRSYS